MCSTNLQYLFRIGIVPLALLHEPLVGAEPGVRGGHALLLLIQLASEPENRTF